MSLPSRILVLATLSLAATGLISAQSSGKEVANFLPNSSLDPGKIVASSFNPSAIGAVTGRIFNDYDPIGTTVEAAPLGISGVKLTIKGVEPTSSNFIREEYSNEDGSFEFSALGPGKYSIRMHPESLPPHYRMPEKTEVVLDVEAYQNATFELAVAPRRSITGVVFIDIDGDGRYRQGKDQAVAGASIAVEGKITETDENGSYSFHELSPGRVGLLIRHPKKNESTHIVLFLSAGPVNNRVVNIPVSR